MDKCTVPAHSAHHADKAHRSRLEKNKKQVNGDCVMHDCAHSSVVNKRLQNGKNK